MVWSQSIWLRMTCVTCHFYLLTNANLKALVTELLKRFVSRASFKYMSNKDNVEASWFFLELRRVLKSSLQEWYASNITSKAGIFLQFFFFQKGGTNETSSVSLSSEGAHNWMNFFWKCVNLDEYFWRWSPNEFLGCKFSCFWKEFRSLAIFLQLK